MNTDVPLRFLVGAARLVAVYFALKGLESSMSGVITYQMQRNATPEMLASMPSIWAIMLPTMGFYAAMVLLTWFGASAMCRLATQVPPASAESVAVEVSMNDTMIFLTGVLVLGWGLSRLGEDVFRFVPRNLHVGSVTVDAFMLFRLVPTLSLMAIGLLMMARFAAIQRWIEKRKKLDQ